MGTTQKLTERRAADRAKMAAEVVAIAAKHGAAADIEPAPLSSRGVWVNIRAARGLRVTIDFDGDSTQPDMHCLAWCVDIDSDARLADRFAPAGYTVNPHHFRKSTQFAGGFEELCEMLAHGLDLAASGEAFDAEREAAQIAKHGTAAESAARFQAYADSLRSPELVL